MVGRLGSNNAEIEKKGGRYGLNTEKGEKPSSEGENYLSQAPQ